MSGPACVITTINPPTKTVETMVDRFPRVIVIGDKKTPPGWNYTGATYFADIPDFKFKAPDNHYARKNLGYLQAMRGGASVIYDIDDDNFPTKDWKMREVDCSTIHLDKPGWQNVYGRLAEGKKGPKEPIIWPRGFSLEHINRPDPNWSFPGKVEIEYSPIQQGLANGDTDVDAIWRLTNHEPYEVTFSRAWSFSLGEGVWCPFNSQTTWWWPEAYPLLYLPLCSTFRMCDIWRSFVAQRCLWAMGHCVTFHSPAEVFQERNAHNLMRDFESEIPGYLHNGRIVELLLGLTLIGQPDQDIVTCYVALVDNDILPPRELESLQLWLKDIHAILG